jgi:hypothetical protein
MVRRAIKTCNRADDRFLPIAWRERSPVQAACHFRGGVVPAGGHDSPKVPEILDFKGFGRRGRQPQNRKISGRRSESLQYAARYLGQNAPVTCVVLVRFAHVRGALPVFWERVTAGRRPRSPARHDGGTRARTVRSPPLSTGDRARPTTTHVTQVDHCTSPCRISF